MFTIKCVKPLKGILLGILLGLWGVATAATPAFVKIGGSAAEMVPEGYKLQSESKGDINKDGIDDMVVLISSGDNSCDSLFTMVYFGTPANKYSLFAAYREGPGCIKLEETEESSVSDEYSCVRYNFSVSITSKGLISYNVGWGGSLGSQQDETETKLFRFQNGDLYCIGSERSNIATWGISAGNGSGQSVNYLTHKIYEYDIVQNNQVNGTWRTGTGKDMQPFTRKSLLKPTSTNP